MVFLSVIVYLVLYLTKDGRRGGLKRKEDQSQQQGQQAQCDQQDQGGKPPDLFRFVFHQAVV